MNRIITRSLALMVPLIALVATFGSEVNAATFVNLSDKPVYVARATYRPYSSQPDVTPAGYLYSGWTKIAPGGVARISAGWLYVESAGSRINWNNLKSKNGVIKTPSFPSAFVSSAQDIAKLEKQGYRRATYQYFPEGNYKIDGTAYRMRTVVHPFGEESRSLKFISNRFRPGGRIVDYSVNYSSRRWADVKWGIQNDGAGIYYGGSIQGRQVRLGGPREPANFKGKVTIRYIQKL